MEKRKKRMIAVVGSTQSHAFIGGIKGVSPCCAAASGCGGGAYRNDC